MTKKRQPNSSIVSILEDDNLNIPDIDEDSSLDNEHDDVNYINMDISTEYCNCKN